MMDNKLSELSKPVGFAREEDIKLMQSGKLLSGLTIWRSGKEALYSQEYVSALLARIAELEAKLATPVRLPPFDCYKPEVAKELQEGFKNIVRAAGFTVEGGEWDGKA